MPKSEEGKSSHDTEKELLAIKRKMAGYYAKGEYEDAMRCALELEENVKKTMGSTNSVYASCVNNMALMNKMLGNTDMAMDQFTQALHIYQDTVGKRHTSYATTLGNLGVLYKTEALVAKGLDKLNLLERAEESLFDAFTLRKELSGEPYF